MQWFKNLQTMKKLMIAFGLIAVILGFVGYQGVRGIRTVADLSDVGSQHALGLIDLKEANFQLLMISRAMSNAVLENDAAAIQKRVDNIKKYREEYLARFNKYRETLVLDAVKVKAADILKQFDTLGPEQDKILELAKSNQDAQAGVELHNLRTMTDKLDADMRELEQVKYDLMQKADDEQEATYRSLRTSILSVIAVGILLAFGIGYFIARLITDPLRQAVSRLKDIAEGEGDLTQRLEVASRDEVGEVAHWFNTFVTKLQDTIRAIGNNAHSVAGSAEELTSVSQQMAANAEETSAQAGVVSAASEQVSKNIQTVAASGEEMGASIKEIAKNASEAARVAGQAVSVAETTNTTIAKLGQSSAEIGHVVKVITSIAEQTNLLALNATIEAARAGEAGKGFAVVANEVKELAKQTAEATEDISQKITAIQDDTQAAVTAIGQIGGVIHQINDIANTIASAVEEQSVTTSEIGRNVEEASKGSSEIAQNITSVAQAAQSTASGATETQAAAQQLARMAAELQQLVGQFKVEEHGAGRAVVVAERPVPGHPHRNGHLTEAQF